MIMKVMDMEDAIAWKNICKRVREAFDFVDGLPKILEDEDCNRDFREKIDLLEEALDSVISDGLYPSYIPTDTLYPK